MSFIFRFQLIKSLFIRLAEFGSTFAEDTKSKICIKNCIFFLSKENDSVASVRHLLDHFKSATLRFSRGQAEYFHLEFFTILEDFLKNGVNYGHSKVYQALLHSRWAFFAKSKFPKYNGLFRHTKTKAFQGLGVCRLMTESKIGLCHTKERENYTDWYQAKIRNLTFSPLNRLLMINH